MVQRYELSEKWGQPEMAKYDYGDYVEYDSYKELDNYYQERIADANEEIEALAARLAEVNAELQKYKDQFPDYVECANCGSVTHVEGVEGAIGQSCCRKEDAQECDHNWIIAPGLFIAEGHKDNVPGSLFCCECGAREWDDKDYKPKNDTQKCKHEREYYYPRGEEYRRCAKCGVIAE